MSATVWNPDLYTQKHNFVFQYGAGLVEVLDPQPNERILDVGCGTGELTKQVSDAGANVVGIDSSEALVVAARQQFPNLTFRHEDATQLADVQQYDAVFSNAALHWIQDQPRVTQAMYQALKPGGRLVVELGGEGNVRQITEALKTALLRYGYPREANISLWYFPSVGQYTTLLEHHGFRVQWARHYARPTRLADTDHGIKDWLKMFAGAYLTSIPSDEQELITTATQEALRPVLFQDQHWYADYQRLRVTAIRPSL